jgi:Dual specificity phosphatase, catalytic domain
MNEEVKTLINEYIDEWTMKYLKDEMKATDEELIYIARLMQHQSQKTKQSSIDIDDTTPSVVIDDFLYQGDIHHAKNINLLRKLGIRYIINSCNERLRDEIQQNFNVLSIHIKDTPNVDINTHFQKTNDFLRTCREKKQKVLVHCYMGVSRSSAIVLAYLMK